MASAVAIPNLKDLILMITEEMKATVIHHQMNLILIAMKNHRTKKILIVKVIIMKVLGNLVEDDNINNSRFCYEDWFTTHSNS